MVLINVWRSQKTPLLLMSHYSFTPSCLHSNTQKRSQVFLFFLLHVTFSTKKKTQSLNLTAAFISAAFFFLCAFETTLLPLSFLFSVFTEGYTNGPCSSCIFDRTNEASVLPWLWAKTVLSLHSSTLALQVERHGQQRLACFTAVSVEISISMGWLAFIASCCHARAVSHSAIEGIRPPTLLVLLYQRRAFYSHGIIQIYSAAQRLSPISFLGTSWKVEFFPNSSHKLLLGSLKTQPAPASAKDSLNIIIGRNISEFMVD